MHPDPDQLHGFVSGTLDDETADRLADHVEQCPECELTVRSLESASDTFIDSLRTPVAADPLRDEPECREMIDAIRVFGHDRSLASRQAAAAATDEPGRHLGQQGQYKLLDKLGEGGMGAVYKALHTELDKIVALKVLSADRTQDEDAVGRFKREMRAVGKLDHPHIVRAMDAGEVDGEHFLVMEYVQGSDLSQLVQQHGPLPIADACELIRQAAIGLDEAHDHGIVHRDIKPSNLILAQRRRKPPIVKILDMGLARLSERESADVKALTSDGQMMGTLDYMAPEQGRGADGVDIRADVYGLGATLYKLLCGQAPFGDKKYEAPINKLMALATEEPRSIAERREGVSPELAAVVHKMLAKESSERYATPADVVAALTPLAAGANLAALAGVDVPVGTHPIDDTSASMSASTPTDPTLDIARERRPDAAARPAVEPQPSARRPFTRSPYLIAAAAGVIGVILLGILLTIRMGDVTVTVETPDGKLPDDVKLLLNGDGDKIEITSDKKWKVDVSPGAYGVEIQGGNDQFAIEDDTLTVSRGGKNILVVRRKPTADAPSAKAARATPEAISEASGPPTTAHTDTDGSRPSDAELLRRLAEVDWKPGPADDKLRGVVASPAVIDGIPGSWQIRHGCGYYGRSWFSPKGNYVVLAHGYDPTGVIFETKAGRAVGAIHLSDGRKLGNCSWSSDETHIACSGELSKRVDIASRDGISEHSSFEIEGGYIFRLAWSPDKSRIAISTSEGRLKIYSSSGPLLHDYDYKAGFGGQWSPDSKYFAVYNWGDPVIEVETGLAICSWPGGTFNWTPDSQSIYSERPGKVSLTTLSEANSRQIPQRSLFAASSPDGRHSLWQNGEIHDPVGKVTAKLDLNPVPGSSRFVWEQPDRIRVVSETFPGYWAEYSPTGRVLASGSTPLWMPVEYGTWLADDERITSANAGNEIAGKKARRFIWSLTGDDDSTIKLAKGGGGTWKWGFGTVVFNPASGNCSFGDGSDQFVFDSEGRLVSEYRSRAARGSYSPDGKMLALLDNYNKTVEIRQDNETIQRLSRLQSNTGTGLQWNPGGTHLCNWDATGTVFVWNVADGSLVAKLEGMDFGESGIWQKRYSSPKWSPDGTQLAMFSLDALHIVSIADGSDNEIAWEGRSIQCPIHWTPKGDGLLIDGKLYNTEGRELGEIKEANGNISEFQWLESTSGAVGVSGSDILIWPSVKDKSVRVPLPSLRFRDRVRPKDLGASVQQLSPSGRYWATIAVHEFSPNGVHGRGNVVLVDLQEQQVAWTGIGFSDGTMIRVGQSGKIVSGPDDIDRYLIYTIRYPEGTVVPLTQLQFAARIGLSPGQQCLQRILDLGGQVQLPQREEPLTRDDLNDARDLPEPSEVVGVSLSGSYFVNSDTLEHLKELAALATLDLSPSRIQDVDLGVLLDIASLRTLNLAGTHVTNNVGAALPAGLEELDLSGTAVDDILLSDLRSFKSLRRVVLTDTKVTDEAIETFRQAMPGCEVVR